MTGLLFEHVLAFAFVVWQQDTFYMGTGEGHRPGSLGGCTRPCGSGEEVAVVVEVRDGGAMLRRAFIVAEEGRDGGNIGVDMLVHGVLGGIFKDNEEGEVVARDVCSSHRLSSDCWLAACQLACDCSPHRVFPHTADELEAEETDTPRERLLEECLLSKKTVSFTFPNETLTRNAVLAAVLPFFEARMAD